MRYLAALLLTVFFTGSALAYQCPTLVNQIDQQLQSAQLDSDTKAKIVELRDRGESLHSQGKHSESIKILNQALSELEAAS
ncbi:MAG: Uncharacterized protein AWU57_1078 [Marinobacter sp. T13-3]|jgi:hypothetical protein|nr:MAG: Uncharacterized protein AWU57_1078 [Marinobacter sp. T13-3]